MHMCCSESCIKQCNETQSNWGRISYSCNTFFYLRTTHSAWSISNQVTSFFGPWEAVASQPSFTGYISIADSSNTEVAVIINRYTRHFHSMWGNWKKNNQITWRIRNYSNERIFSPGTIFLLVLQHLQSTSPYQYSLTEQKSLHYQIQIHLCWVVTDDSPLFLGGWGKTGKGGQKGNREKNCLQSAWFFPCKVI